MLNSASIWPATRAGADFAVRSLRFRVAKPSPAMVDAQRSFFCREPRRHQEPDVCASPPAKKEFHQAGTHIR